ncbi:MAG TPA: trypsin-like peptidase domain-containing protein [Planctomycetota bacterium]|nr:trypsin-like peptidase domain-containing protein [Planctomycetota bacterium]
MRHAALLLLAVAAAGEEDPLAQSRARVRALEAEMEAVIAKVAPAVGAVTNYMALFDEKTGRVAVTPRSLGSGLVVTQDGYMLTNVHVVEGAGYLTVALPGGIYPARLHADTSQGAVKGDIALIKLGGDTRFPFVDWRVGESKNLEPGTFVLALGNPHGHALDGTPMATLGIISGNGRAASEAGFLYVDVIQTDAEINPGNSGGPLFDMAGHFLGINGLMSSRQGRSNSGVGFSIPVDQIRLFMKSLLKEGETTGYGFHGLVVDSTPDESGAKVLGVHGGSPADEAGLRPSDVITKVKGEAVKNRTDFVNAMDRLPEKTLVAITYRRGRNVKTAKFRLASFAEWQESVGRATPQGPLPVAERGFLGAEWNEEPTGVYLSRVVPGAAADRGKLLAGDILLRIEKTDVPTVKALVECLATLPSGAKVKVGYEREGKKRDAVLVLSTVAEAAGVGQ